MFQMGKMHMQKHLHYFSELSGFQLSDIVVTHIPAVLLSRYDPAGHDLQAETPGSNISENLSEY